MSRAIRSRKRLALIGCAVFAGLSFALALDGGMPWWAGAFWIVCFLALLVPGSRRLVDEVDITDLGVTRRFGPWLGRKREERVLWEELTRVEILTTDKQNLFFLLEGRDGAGVAVSNALAVKHELVAILQRRLPGLDSRAIIEASGSTPRRRFLVWQIQTKRSRAAKCARLGLQGDSENRMPSETYPVAIVAAEAAARTRQTNYPEPFASRMAGRLKRPLGDVFGLSNFGVNLTRLAPGAVSSLRHAHTKQDEFVYILQGHPTLHTDEGRTKLSPGMCAGFRKGTGNGHRLVNETREDVVYLEVGDRTPGDEGSYPDDDIKAMLVDGSWRFVHKDGSPY